MKIMKSPRWSPAALTVIALMLPLMSLTAFAQKSNFLPQLARGTAWSFDDRYRIGDEWGKIPVSRLLLEENPEIAGIAHATARVRGGGTGFYIGKHNGTHLVATNHHVCPSEHACVGTFVIFPLLRVAAEATELLGSWTDVDLAILAVNLSDKDAETLAEYSQKFGFDFDVYPGQPLITAGFGGADNPDRNLVINFDEDCKVFSGAAEYRFMADPDEFNPGGYRSWSFANGCDVSHGDSGSAMVDRQTGIIVGIIWTGRIPKSPEVQSSAYLEEILAANADEIWTELSYAVPSVKIASFLTQLIEDEESGLSENVRTTLSALLQSN